MDNFRNQEPYQKQGLYDPRFEHDNCGIGAVVNIDGTKTRDVVENALKIVENLEHRAGKDADGKTGDGVGIMLQISHEFFKKETKKLGISIGKNVNTEWECSFFLKTNSEEIRQKNFLR